MPSLKDMTIDPATTTIRALVYAVSGAGKTTLAGSFPEPIFVLDFDHKLKPLYGKDIDFESFNCEDKSGAQKEFERFWATLKKVKNDPKYKTVVLDSLTIFDTLAIWYLIQKGGKGIDKASLEVYGYLSDLYNFLFLELNSAKLLKNMVVLAHEQYIVEEESQLHRIMPMITGTKMLAKLPNYFEEVYHLTASLDSNNKMTRKLWYRPHGKAIGNSLLLRGTAPIEDPTYDKIMSQAKQERK